MILCGGDSLIMFGSRSFRVGKASLEAQSLRRLTSLVRSRQKSFKDLQFLTQRDLDDFLNRGSWTSGEKRDLRAAVQHSAAKRHRSVGTSGDVV